jgi:hypothetical protein
VYLLHSIQTGSRAHPASYPIGTGGSIRERQRREAGHSPPTIAEVKKVNNDVAVRALSDMPS